MNPATFLLRPTSLARGVALALCTAAIAACGGGGSDGMAASAAALATSPKAPAQATDTTVTTSSSSSSIPDASIASGTLLMAAPVSAVADPDRPRADLIGGGSVTVWRTAGYPQPMQYRASILAQRANPGGQPLDGEAEVAFAQYGPGAVSYEEVAHPAVAALPDGGWVVAWTRSQIYAGRALSHAYQARRFSASGQASADVLALGGSTAAATFTLLVLADGSVTATPSP